jgi:hypothetical protein
VSERQRPNVAPATKAERAVLLESAALEKTFTSVEPH